MDLALENVIVLILRCCVIELLLRPTLCLDQLILVLTFCDGK